MNEQKELLGIDLYDGEDFSQLLIRFIFTFLINIIIVRMLYYPKSHRKDYLFTYIMISSVVFLLCFLLENVKLQLGFALGLFAIFGIIRYRTSTVPIKEMTYLFVIIGVSVINALANKKISYAELLFTNFAIIFIIYMLENVWLVRHESRKTITYEKIDLIHPSKREELLADLECRTGLDINRIEIGRLNFLRDTANIRIFYYEDENSTSYEEDEINAQSNNEA